MRLWCYASIRLPFSLFNIVHNNIIYLDEAILKATYQGKRSVANVYIGCDYLAMFIAFLGTSIPRNQKFIIGLDSLYNQHYMYLAPFGYLTTILKVSKLL